MKKSPGIGGSPRERHLTPTRGEQLLTAPKEGIDLDANFIRQALSRSGSNVSSVPAGTSQEAFGEKKSASFMLEHDLGHLAGGYPEDEMTTSFLIEAAEIETRLRSYILELLEPTIRAQQVLDGRLKSVSTGITVMREDIRQLSKIKDNADQFAQSIEVFRVDLSRWDEERKTHQQAVNDRLSLQETDLVALRASVEGKCNDHRSMHRTLKGLGDLVNQVREETVEVRRYVVERVDLNRDKIAKLRDEVENRAATLEGQMLQLQDSRTDTTTFTHHVEEMVALLGKRVDDADRNIADVWRSKANVSCLEEQQHDLAEFMRHMNGTVSSLKGQFDSVVNDVKGHFATATKALGTSTAKQMDEIRGQYMRDAKQVEEMQHGVDEFMRQQVEQRQGFVDEVSAVQVKVDSGVDGLRRDVEQLARKLHGETNNVVVELGQLRRQLQELKSSVRSPESSRGFRNEVMEMLVESQLLSASLDLQDDLDRKSIALYGYKPTGPAVPPSPDKGHTTTPSSTLTLPELAPPDSAAAAAAAATATAAAPGRSPRRRPQALPPGAAGAAAAAAAAAPAGDHPVLLLEKRCLSCNPCMGNAMTGFKMACLQYAPSPVEYEKASWSRSELIRRRMELMRHAKEQLRPKAVD